MMKNNKSQKLHRSGLTLVEVMIVLFILVMMMGVSVLVFQGQRDLAKKRTALAYVKFLAGAVDRYEGDVAKYPPVDQWLQALMEMPSDPSISGKWGGPYIINSATSLDPWENPYQYACPGKHGRFDIWSLGPDMVDGTDDDIGNWKSDL